ncbi:TatD family hydrolase [Candidatus Azambacteria bacterium]|nr:TatD family hydrolase [Candidatus Azambacteria bacterium]
MNFIDSHTHVQFEDFDQDRDGVIKRSLGLGLGMINVGTDEDSSVKAIELANKYEQGLYATIGVHPNDGILKEKIDWLSMENLAKNIKVVGVGETGLDYFRIIDQDLRVKQKEIFIKHLEIAQKNTKPLVIHCRPSKGTLDAYQDLIEILKRYYIINFNDSFEENSQLQNLKSKILNLKSLNGVIHFFQGDLQTAEQFFKLGFLVSFSGVLTFDHQLDNLVKELPLEKILVETDAPFATPVPYRGQRNEPKHILEVIKKIAVLKNLDFETVADQILKNTRTLFKI